VRRSASPPADSDFSTRELRAFCQKWPDNGVILAVNVAADEPYRWAPVLIKLSNLNNQGGQRSV